jgi:hypothetical protein
MRGASQRGTDDFVDEVVDKLGADEGEVRQIVAALRALERPTWGNSSENLEHFNTLRRRIERVQAALRVMPDYVRFMMFVPEDSETLDTMAEEAELELAKFTGLLEKLHARCDTNIVAKPGVHGNSGFREHQAAIEARLLLERHGKPVTLSETSLYNEITDLLCRAAWGGPVRDRKQACKAVLSAPIRTEWILPDNS